MAQGGIGRECAWLVVGDYTTEAEDDPPVGD